MKFPSPHPGIINFFLIHVDPWLSFRPLIRGLSISSLSTGATSAGVSLVSVPSSGDYQFLRLRRPAEPEVQTTFPSPHPGIINFFNREGKQGFRGPDCFRPLIRGLSISSVIIMNNELRKYLFPSPHPGIINFFYHTARSVDSGARFPSPHPGIINFFRTPDA